MMQKYFRLPNISVGTIKCYRHSTLSSEEPLHYISKKEFYCRVLTGTWDDIDQPNFKELGPYDTFGEALVTLIEYGNGFLKSCKSTLEELREFIKECHELSNFDLPDEIDAPKREHRIDDALESEGETMEEV